MAGVRVSKLPVIYILLILLTGLSAYDAEDTIQADTLTANGAATITSTLENTYLPLGGQWEFYWNEFVHPEELKSFGLPGHAQTMAVPGD